MPEYVGNLGCSSVKVRRRPDQPPVDVGPLQFQVQGSDLEPRNILEKIVWAKEKEIEARRSQLPLAKLRTRVASAPPVRDFLGSLRRSPHPVALIAEVKRASPSRGIIREDFDPAALALAYAAGGADVLSVLTDKPFFGGSFSDLTLVREAVELPVLCKEFILSPYQIYLARAHGADAILLIAAILSDTDLNYLLRITEQLGMTALVEVHDSEELDRVLAIEGVTLIGINNRDLTTFDVSLQTTRTLIAERGTQFVQRGITVVSESGIFSPADLATVGEAGARAVLVGESLLRQPDVAQAVIALLGKR